MGEIEIISEENITFEQMTKHELFKDIEEIKSDRLLITESVDNVEEEIKHNGWSISISDEIAEECTVDELRKFLNDVKTDRKAQLRKSKMKVGLIYYLWIDEQAGQLRFNFINSNHKKLPFSSMLTFVEREEDILSNYLNRKRTDFIAAVRVFKELIFL